MAKAKLAPKVPRAKTQSVIIDIYRLTRTPENVQDKEVLIELLNESLVRVGEGRLVSEVDLGELIRRFYKERF